LSTAFYLRGDSEGERGLQPEAKPWRAASTLLPGQTNCRAAHLWQLGDPVASVSTIARNQPAFNKNCASARLDRLRQQGRSAL
jgi:hypothetical protein